MSAKEITDYILKFFEAALNSWVVVALIAIWFLNWFRPQLQNFLQRVESAKL
ncbi:hypothetical protein HYR54_02125 [Candidatus Acetothermia bacterium]|nr:hypothetical protein [Candidatus Acetothermia bacterium]